MAKQTRSPKQSTAPATSGISTRTWLLTLAVVVLLEYIILSWTSRYGGDQSVVTYVLFASSLVAIVLALVIILFLYYHNIGQQGLRKSIAHQVEQLRGTANDIVTSRSGLKQSVATLDEELRRLGDLGDRLDRAIETLNESKVVLEADLLPLQDKLLPFRDDLIPQDDALIDASDTDGLLSDEQLATFLRDTTSLERYALWYGYVKRRSFHQTPLSEHASRFAIMWREMDTKRQPHAILGYAYSSFLVIMVVFRRLGLLHITRQGLEFHPLVTKYVAEYVEPRTQKKGDVFYPWDRVVRRYSSVEMW